GYIRIYNSLVYDYLYPNPSSVMAFIENHDTDRFLANGQDVDVLKQALALLLTMNRTPQLYYGTEVLMNGTKEITDGNVRKDFPGGFPGDERNAFTPEGRTEKENDMFNWMCRLLHWRQTSDCVIKGTQKQFIPYKGIYVVARQYDGKTVMTIINGRNKPAVMGVERYQEVIGGAATATDIPTGTTVNVSQDIRLSPKQVLVLEF
ncbi:MAG: cyclomaltodextrinase C-terminal domain-containing protein, partial [Prevotella sp.]|nr:cyclomaltodextrinase C-terminal domain-containing protein [Prevotella sp.]